MYIRKWYDKKGHTKSRKYDKIFLGECENEKVHQV